MRNLRIYHENQLANMLANYANAYNCLMQSSMKEFSGTYAAAARISQLMVGIVEHINSTNIEPAKKKDLNEFDKAWEGDNRDLPF